LIRTHHLDKNKKSDPKAVEEAKKAYLEDIGEPVE